MVACAIDSHLPSFFSPPLFCDNLKLNGIGIVLLFLKFWMKIMSLILGKFDLNGVKLRYLIRINFRAHKISRKFAQKRPNARNFIRELRAEKSCAKINPREKFQNEKCLFSSLFFG